MDPEQPSSALLAPTLENLASVKVFPLIPALKKDVINTIGVPSLFSSMFSNPPHIQTVLSVGTS